RQGWMTHMSGAPSTVRPLTTQRFERSAHLVHKRLRLLPRGKVRALWDAVVVDELGIRLLSPALRRLVDLFGESAHGDRDLDAPHIEEAARRKVMLRVPVEACRRDRGVRQPVEREVVEDVVPRHPFWPAVERARK